jgi:hypothetical protein
MLTLPKSLLHYYSKFALYAVDVPNISNALSEKRQPRWWKHLPFVLNEIKIGNQIFEISTIWNEKHKDKDNSDQVTQENLSDRANKLQAEFIKKGKYYHNIAYAQSEEEHRLLDSSIGKPLLIAPPQNGDFVVIDAAIELKDSKYNLVDYPPQFQKISDGSINLQLSNESTKENLERKLRDITWHPYCRVLGSYITLEVEKPVLKPWLISFRDILTVPSTSDIRDELLQEYDESISELLYKHISWRQEERTNILMGSYEEKRNICNELRQFEDNIFSGPLGFFVGLYYFNKTDQGRMRSTGWKNSFHVMRQEWKETVDNPDLVTFLTPEEQTNFKSHCIRFGAPQIDELVGDLASD